MNELEIIKFITQTCSIFTVNHSSLFCMFSISSYILWAEYIYCFYANDFTIYIFKHGDTRNGENVWKWFREVQILLLIQMGFDSLFFSATFNVFSQPQLQYNENML